MYSLYTPANILSWQAHGPANNQGRQAHGPANIPSRQAHGPANNLFHININRRWTYAAKEMRFDHSSSISIILCKTLARDIWRLTAVDKSILTSPTGKSSKKYKLWALSQPGEGHWTEDLLCSEYL